ncbi:hypothetical protein EBB06_12560 [Crenobacter cavernae]|uniref:Tip attachment protein J domain-containing protein n=1 Tax=Crenobacter cavernae TaxID=2290923 RepID=A0ABY0FAN5_9NEIS|nr:hypothetical protein EBB06_12560 [Crenobacter cavernae]
MVSVPHPLVDDGRQVAYAAFRAGETLGAYVKRHGIKVASGPLAVLVNGAPIPSTSWRAYRVKSGDHIVLRATVEGGGGGGKILRTVAMIALIFVANAYGAVLGEALGFAGTAAAGVGAGLIMMGGSMLINALLPPPQPQQGALGRGADSNVSPTYALGGGRNRARLFEPMPLVIGRHKIVPDAASNPYTEYVAQDEQYLYQAFHFGLQPDLVLTDFKIGDTPLSSYQDVQLELSGADGRLGMVAGNVDTLPGFDLKSADGWATRTTPADTEEIQLELAATLFYANDNGGIDGRGATVAVEYRPVGAAEWLPGGDMVDVLASGYWSLGRYYYTAWAQMAYGGTDPNQPPAGPTRPGYSWRFRPYSEIDPHNRNDVRGLAPDRRIGVATTNQVYLAGSSTRPVRRVVRLPVARGQYEVRVCKLTGDVAGSRESNQVAVAQIRAYQASDTDYTGQRRVGLKIRATAQLNGVVDELSAIAEAACPVWNGTGWTVQPTVNPAWWLLWAARGDFGADGRLRYGVGLSDAQLDLEAIKAFGAFCDAQRLTVSLVVDGKLSCAELLARIARCGRGSPTWQTGRLGVVWDQAALPVVAVFGPANIKAGSFEVAYVGENTADEVIVNFVNASTWKPDQVRAPVPGVTSPSNPVTLDFLGCTDADMAGREANLIAASQLYHRRRVSWETDYEGFVANRGDVVLLSHDLTQWGQSGRLLGGDRHTLTLDRPVPLPQGQGYLTLRAPDGRLASLRVAGGTGDAAVLELVDPVPELVDGEPFPVPADDDGYPACDWLWMYDPLATPGLRVKIVGAEPSGDGVKFSAIDDNPDYYASESRPVASVPPRVVSPRVADVQAVSFAEAHADGLTDEADVTARWRLSLGGPVRVAIEINGQVRLEQRVDGDSLTVRAKRGDELVARVTPLGGPGISAGTSLRASHSVLAGGLPAVTGLVVVGGAFNGRDLAWQWNPVGEARAYAVEIWTGAVRRRVMTVTDTHANYTFADNLADGGPYRALTVKVAALGARGITGPWSTLTATNAAPAAPASITVAAGYRSIFVNLPEPSDPDVAGARVWLSTSADFAVSDGLVVYDGPDRNLTLTTGAGGVPLEADTTYYLRAAWYDVFGKDGLQPTGAVSVVPVSVAGGIQPGEIESAMLQAVDAAKVVGTLQDWQLASLQAGKLLGQITADQFAGRFGSGNLAQNPSFELSSGAPYYPYNNAGMAVTTSLVAGRSGGQALRFEFSGAPNNSQQGLTGPVLADGWRANTTYVLSVWVRAGGGQLGRGLGLNWNVSPAVTTTLLNPPLSGQWQRYAWRIAWGGSVELDPGKLFISSDLSGPARNGWLEFDDLQVEEGDVLTQYNAFAQRLEKTEADTAGNTARISTEETARANADAANATAINQVSARINAGGDVANSISAANIKADQALAELGNKASASSVQALSAKVDGSRKEVFVQGDKGTFYPVRVWFGNGSETLDLKVDRPDVHADGTWMGSYTAQLSVRASNWGNAAPAIFEVTQLAGGGNYSWGLGRIEAGLLEWGVLLWLRGGMTHQITSVGRVADINIALPNAQGVYVEMAGTPNARSWQPLAGEAQPLAPWLGKTYRPGAPVSKDSVESLPETIATVEATLSRVSSVEAALPGKANVSDVTTLTARVGSAEANVTNLQQAQATLDGKVAAKWGVVLEAADAQGNRRISGLQAFNDGTTSAFVVTASQMLVGDFTNLVGNPSGEGGRVDGWIGAGGNITASAGPHGWAANGPVLNVSGRDHYYGKFFAVKPGDEFFVSMDCTPAGGLSSPYSCDLGLAFSSDGAGETDWSYGATAAASGSGNRSVSGVVTIPAGANFAKVWLRVNGPGGHPEVWHCWNVVVKRRNSGNLLVDGSVTSNKIASNEIKARHVDTYDLIANSAIVGQLTADQGFVNQMRTNILVADAVTANHIDSRGLTIKDSSGNVIFGAGQNLDVGRITGLGSLATANGVSTAQVSGLGALATKSQVAASDMAVGSLSAISANLGTVTAGKAQNASGTNVVDFNAAGTASFIKVGAAIDIKADGSGVFARTIVSAPDVKASGTASVNSGWLGGSGAWTVYIDTGVDLPVGWSTASSDMYQASATIAGGQSQSGGANGYAAVDVVIGDGLLSGAANSPIDNRMYVKFTWNGAGTSGGSILITAVAWKLVRV